MPQGYDEAVNGPYGEYWLAAMREEINSLLAHETYSLVVCPKGAKPIPVRWVYALKRDEHGQVARFKARLVAKGFKQRAGIDYDELFAPVCDRSTMRAFLSMVASDDLELQQLDVKNAFLNAVLSGKHTLHMHQPPGFQVGDSSLVCELHKAIYGLKQAPHAWYEHMKADLLDLGFTVADADPALFILRKGTEVLRLLVHVDDMLLASKSTALVNSVKSMLAGKFDVRDLGDARLFCGIAIERDRAGRTLKIHQLSACTDLAVKFDMTAGKACKVPLDPSNRLVREGVSMHDPVRYQELVGALLYLSTCTRPDIAHSVGVLSRYMAAPTDEHWRAALRVLRYVYSTRSMGIVYGKSAELHGYCDADFAGDIDTARSTTGYVFLLNGGAIHWQSRLQQTVALATTEAEYMSASNATREALWLRTLVADLGVPVATVRMHTDNQSALAQMHHQSVKRKSKHIHVMYHFIREHIQRSTVTFAYVATNMMWADFLTKALLPLPFLACIMNIGMR